MSTVLGKNTNINGASEDFELKKRKQPVHRITPDSFASQVKDMDHKDLFAIQKSITAELDRRRAEADKLVEELRGGSSVR
jgi:hypothetical protein